MYKNVSQLLLLYFVGGLCVLVHCLQGLVLRLQEYDQSTVLFIHPSNSVQFCCVLLLAFAELDRQEIAGFGVVLTYFWVMVGYFPSHAMQGLTTFPLDFGYSTDHQLPVLSSVHDVLVEHERAERERRIDHGLHLEHLVVVEHIGNIVSHFDVLHQLLVYQHDREAGRAESSLSVEVGDVCFDV